MSVVLSSRICIIDDEPHNLLLLSKLLSRHGFRQIKTTGKPQEVYSMIQRGEIDLLLLDLHMPEVSGLQMLEQLQPYISPKTQTPVPVLVLTGDNSTDSRRAALTLGARDFVSKPFDPPEVICRIQNLLEARMLQVNLVFQSEQLEALVAERTQQLRENQIESVRRLGLAAEYRDDATGLHIHRVSQYSALLAEAAGQGPAFIEQIRQASQLHDIGKLAIPDSILLKPGALTSEERKIMQNHVAMGATILGGSSCPILRMAEQIARYHHEHWNGQGYLEGLKGEQIPLCARIVAIADVFDALISARPYKPAWPVSKALVTMEQSSGRQFDPRLFELFLDLAPQSCLAA